ncbi:MAG TPA: ZIP family metal transporter [Thermoanaerobaculia bacterium]|nr:ZIP family metal transporter [Thermoanaerobaculia bacterium]
MAASPLLLSFVIVAAGLLAAVLPFFFRWTHRSAHRWIAFGAGTILGAAFLHMIPEGYELAGRPGFGMIILGFLALYLLEQLTLRHPHEEEAGEFYELGLLAFAGMTLHDLIDGIALGSGHHVPSAGPAIFAALALHKIPTTFAVSLLMVHGGYTRKRILTLLTILLLAIPAGVLVSETTIRLIGESSPFLIGMLVNFSAGTFIYIGAYELLPEMQRKAEKGSLIGLYFVAGLATMFVLKLLHPVF